MTTQPTSGTAPASATGGALSPTGANGVLGQNEFLKIMIAQLVSQNPLEPGNSNEFVTELTQLTQVEQITNLASADQLSSAVSLIGRTVSYENGTGETVSGVLETVQADASGTTVTIGGTPGIALSEITEVQ